MNEGFIPPRPSFWAGVTHIYPLCEAMKIFVGGIFIYLVFVYGTSYSVL